MKYADRLKSRRKELGLSADEVGEKIGKNQATIHRYENGDIRKIPINVLEPLAKALMTTPEYLLGLDDEPSTREKILLQTVETVLKEYLSDTLTTNILEEICEKMNRAKKLPHDSGRSRR